MIVVGVQSEAQRRAAQALSHSHHVDQMVIATLSEPEVELVGRDNILQSARHHALLAHQQAPHAPQMVGVARGVVLSPAGTFMQCSAVWRSHDGHERLGWSQPRMIPESVAVAIGRGHTLEHVMLEYRQRWQMVDPYSLTDIDELITAETSYGEALAEVIDQR